MTKKKSKTEVGTNNEKEMVNALENRLVEVDNQYCEQRKYLFNFETAEESIIFSAMILQGVLDEIIFKKGKLDLNITTTVLPNGLDLFRDNGYLNGPAIDEFLNGFIKLEPKVFIKANFPENSEIAQIVKNILDEFHDNSKKLKTFINRFTTDYGNNFDFLVDVIGVRHCSEFRRNFVEQRIISSVYSIDENNNAKIRINFLLPEEQKSKNNNFFRQSVWREIRMKEYSTDYDYTDDFVPNFSYKVSSI